MGYQTVNPLCIHLQLTGAQGAAASRLLSNLGNGIIERKTCYRRLSSRYYSDLPAKSHTKDGRSRLSSVWIPTGGITESASEDSHAKLIRAGFLRQAHSGIFHMLPLGRRVQDKLEALIDKYMSTLNASKLALSSISSQELWTKSGRLSNAGSEVFRFKDRKETGYLLAPTHEEEITTVVSTTTTSYKNLPVRLYQISRKYRDEKRPRQGLLRSREFIMKDLYTFDYSSSLALATYWEVKEVYARLFNELKLPYIVAEADSGNMGGTLSHEFHFPTSKGEDHVISCDSCGFVTNEELVDLTVVTPTLEELKPLATDIPLLEKPYVWRGITLDRKTLINYWYPAIQGSSSTETPREVNAHAVKAIVPELDSSIEDPLSLWKHHASQPSGNSSARSGASQNPQILDLIHVGKLGQNESTDLSPEDLSRNSGMRKWDDAVSDEFATYHNVRQKTISRNPQTGTPLNLLRIGNGDPCTRCHTGKLKVQKAIELGHTFHLGARYSEPLEAVVTVPTNILLEEDTTTPSEKASLSNAIDQKVPMQMGCHGIGVSRIIGAVADTLADEKGLNWPRVMAPYEVVIVAVPGREEAGLEVYDKLSDASSSSEQVPLDLILDDREKRFAWKMGDADLVGYPIIVVVGKGWDGGIVEVQCRRLQIRKDVLFSDLAVYVRSLLDQI